MSVAAASVASRQPVRRDAIIDSAMVHFSERQYEEVSIDDICRDAGVAHGLVSYYFGGKRGLFAAAVERAWQDLLDYERPRGDESGATDRVHGYIRRHFEYVREHATRFTGLMHSTSADPQIRAIAQDAQAMVLSELVTSLGCPSNPPHRLRVALRGWVGFLDSATGDWLAHEGMGIDEIVDLCYETLVAAVRVAGGSRFDEATQEEALRLASDPERRFGPLK